MEPDEMTEQLVEADTRSDSKPKPLYRDETAYLITAAGLAAYAQTNDIRILIVLVALYAIGNFAMRITSQIVEGKRR